MTGLEIKFYETIPTLIRNLVKELEDINRNLKKIEKILKEKADSEPVV